VIKISNHTHTALSDQQLQKNLLHVLEKTVTDRNEAVSDVPNWEELREYARQVKSHTLSRLDYYLEELESKVQGKGAKVIWAETPQQAIEFILDLAHHKQMNRVIKSKSMLTEEIHLNQSLERFGINPIETDLGEYIVQLAGETPSHLIAPALHKSRGEIANLFVEKVGMSATDDVVEITATARRILRDHFLTAQIGITGANFAVSETGTIVVVENEGNIRLTASVPEIHVAMMGIEKVIPRQSDLSVFLKLLTRSATGQKITSYINCLTGACRDGEMDGPREFYLVLIDNGRTRILRDAYLRQTLACIRCGACQNVCPVYQRLGGHAYGSTYQGPIGAILTPQLESVEKAPEHSFASSLCGACYEVCPVKIEIPHILLKLRNKTQTKKNNKAAHLPMERWAVQLWSWIMQSSYRYERLAACCRVMFKVLSKREKLKSFIPLLKPWIEYRELPSFPEQSFRDLYQSGEQEK